MTAGTCEPGLAKRDLRSLANRDTYCRGTNSLGTRLMEPPMQHLSAPRENLQTWNRVTKIITWSCILIALLLLAMAAALL